VDELDQWPAGVHGLQGTPINVVAKIRAGIAGQARRQRGPAQRGKQGREGGVAPQRAWLTGFNRPIVGIVAVRVRKQDRARIAGARLDANIPPPAGEPEDQHHVRLLRQELRQIAVDCCVGCGKDMACDVHFGERRSAPPRQRRCQMPARI